LLLAGSLVLPVYAQSPSDGTTNANKPHPPLTKEQANELFRSVDEILNFVSSDTKLPIQHSVKRKLVTRDEVNKYLRDKFNEDEGAKRMLVLGGNEVAEGVCLVRTIGTERNEEKAKIEELLAPGS
jgi:hypothetical protein